MSFKPKENHGCYSMIRVAVVVFFFMRIFGYRIWDRPDMELKCRLFVVQIQSQ